MVVLRYNILRIVASWIIGVHCVQRASATQEGECHFPGRAKLTIGYIGPSTTYQTIDYLTIPVISMMPPSPQNTPLYSSTQRETDSSYVYRIPQSILFSKGIEISEAFFEIDINKIKTHLMSQFLNDYQKVNRNGGIEATMLEHIDASIVYNAIFKTSLHQVNSAAADTAATKSVLSKDANYNLDISCNKSDIPTILTLENEPFIIYVEDSPQDRSNGYEVSFNVYVSRKRKVYKKVQLFPNSHSRRVIHMPHGDLRTLCVEVTFTKKWEHLEDKIDIREDRACSAFTRLCLTRSINIPEEYFSSFFANHHTGLCIALLYPSVYSIEKYEVLSSLVITPILIKELFLHHEICTSVSLIKITVESIEHMPPTPTIVLDFKISKTCLKDPQNYMALINNHPILVQLILDTPPIQSTDPGLTALSAYLAPPNPLPTQHQPTTDPTPIPTPSHTFSMNTNPTPPQT